MRILLDECLPVDLRHSLSFHDAHTVQYAGFKGLSNGELLRSAESAAYDVLLTLDRGLPHQQSSAGRTIAIVILHARTTQIADIEPLMPAVIQTLKTIKPGEVRHVT